MPTMGLMAIAILAGSSIATAALVLFTALTARQARISAPPIGHFIDVDGARLHYLDRGAGPVVVLVHGLGGNLRNFHGLIEALALTCRVVAVDRPGSGYSTMLSDGHPTLRPQARILARFIQRLELGRPLLVGHSLGGALSLALALDHPSSVRGLVLISALSQVERAPPPLFKALNIHSPSLRWLIAWTVMAPLGKLAHRETLSALFAPELVPDNFDVESGGTLGLRPPSFVAASKDMVSVADELAIMTPRYASLSLPVDVIFGRQDPILDYRTHGQRFASTLPQATLHLIDGGHMLPVTAVDQIATRIKRAADHAGGD